MLQWITIFFCFFFICVPVEGILRREVPSEISDRCKALAFDINSMPDEQQHAFHALQICKPEFKLWFWQSPDEQALIQLEEVVLRIRSAREREIAIVCSIVLVIVLGELLIRIRTTLAWMWNNPYLAILRFVTPIYDNLWQSYTFSKDHGSLYALLLAVFALVFTFFICLYYFIFNKLQVFGIAVLMFGSLNVFSYLFFRCGFRLVYGADPWLGEAFLEDIFIENNAEFQNAFNNVAPASMALFM
jgi:hypothetical protein